MKKYKTTFTNNYGDVKHTIYLLVKEDGSFDLQCDLEIPAGCWYMVYEESIAAYKAGKLEEVKDNGKK